MDALLIAKWFDEDLTTRAFVTANITQGDQTSAATAAVLVTITAGSTQGDQTSSASAGAGVSGTAGVLQDDQTAAIAAAVLVSGTASVTQDDQTSAATAAALVTITSGAVQADQTSASLADVRVTVACALTQDDHTCSGTVTVVHTAESILRLDQGSNDPNDYPTRRAVSVPAVPPLNVPVPPPVPEVTLDKPKRERKNKGKPVDSGLRRGIVEVPGVVAELRVTPPAVSRAKRRVAIDKPAVPPAASTSPPPDWRDDVDVEALERLVTARAITSDYAKKLQLLLLHILRL